MSESSFSYSFTGSSVEPAKKYVCDRCQMTTYIYGLCPLCRVADDLEMLKALAAEASKDILWDNDTSKSEFERGFIAGYKYHQEESW